MGCPRCGGQLAITEPDWRRCTACAYEMTEDSYRLYGELTGAHDRDPAAFFAWVRSVRDELRALEPAWQRTL